MSYSTIRYSPSRSPRLYTPIDTVRYIPLRHGSSPAAGPRRYSPVPADDVYARSPTSQGLPKYEDTVDDEIRRLEADRRAWEVERDRVISERQKRREEEARRETEAREARLRQEDLPRSHPDYERDIEHRARESHEFSQQLDREIEEYYEQERHGAAQGKPEDPFRSHRWMELHQRLMRDRANWHRERQADLDRIQGQIVQLAAEKQALAREREALLVTRDGLRREADAGRRAQVAWGQARDAERKALLAEREALLTSIEAQEAEAAARQAQFEQQQRELDEARAAHEAERRRLDDDRRQLAEERARFADERERWERDHAAPRPAEEIRPRTAEGTAESV